MIALNRRELAEWLHNEYEEIAVDVGWETQDGTSVPFNELPDENREVMLRLADRILERFPLIRMDKDQQRQLPKMFMPAWLRRRYAYLHVGEQSGGKTSQLSQQLSEQFLDRFSNLDDYDWVTPEVFVCENSGGGKS